MFGVSFLSVWGGKDTLASGCSGSRLASEAVSSKRACVLLGSTPKIIVWPQWKVTSDSAVTPQRISEEKPQPLTQPCLGFTELQHHISPHSCSKTFSSFLLGSNGFLVLLLGLSRRVTDSKRGCTNLHLNVARAAIENKTLLSFWQEHGKCSQNHWEHRY